MKRHILFVEASTTGAGALANQLARDMGLHSTLLARRPRAYSADVLGPAGEIIECDTNDAQQVVAVCKRLARVRPIHAITTTADMHVPQAALAAQELGLPGMSYQAALRARNKHRMRVALANGAPEHNVPFALVEHEAEARAAAQRLGYPLVAKPQEENDGVNVRLICDDAQLSRYMEAARQWTTNSAGQAMTPGVLLETFVDGVELSVETVQAPGGPCQVMGVTTKEMIGFERGHFVEAGHAFPYQGAGAEIAIAATRAALEALEVDCGVVHTECRITGGTAKIMEVNPRLAGGKIGSHLIEIATGRSAVQAVLDVALGHSSVWQPAHERGAAIHFLWADQPGRFQGIENMAALKAMPGVIDVLPIASPGAMVRVPQNNGDSLAEILAQGATAADAYARVEAAFSAARIVIMRDTQASVA